MSEQSDSWRIEADPTKEFFVFMLTRDIDLDDAVTDLIDNSVDGARRLRSRGRYDGLRVEIDVTREHFLIDDNCGGIPVDVARKYAFRFGRVQDTPSTPGSIGQFGVGMKRGLFKLGRNFRIESTAERSRFVVEIDVAAWQRQKEWDFTIADLQQPPTPFPESDHGTRIEVTNLIRVYAE